MKAIVTGMIATYPVGGVVWDYGQYALGLEQLGFDVCYLEDTGGNTYDPRVGDYVSDCSYGVAFLQRSLSRLSGRLGQRWHFRSVDGECHGMSSEEIADAAAEADLFLNVSGGTLLRNAYKLSRRKVLIDTDPGWNHFRNYPRADRDPSWGGAHGFRAHDFFFTYAAKCGQADCILPSLGIDWQPTRPPVVPECWAPELPGERWTTVMTWDNFREPIVYNGATYGTKELEFAKIETLPRHVGAPLEIAVGGNEPPRARWRELGWHVSESEQVSRTLEDYRHFVQSSRGEFSVAKNVYVATRSGWFSCRSVCYLAAGRPVVTQDTGFSDVIDCGEGLIAFSSLDDATLALRVIEADYERHQAAARRLAEHYFSAGHVLGEMLNRIGL